MLVNPSVRNTLISKGWNGVSGLVSIPFILYYLDPVTQGLYYAFLSIVAIQGFIELGLSIILVVFSSHEWSVLAKTAETDVVKTNVAKSRLTSLSRFSLKYFGVGAGIFFLAAMIYGSFVMGDENNISWQLPWIMHISVSALVIWLSPILSIYEGCNNVASASMYRFYISFLGSLALLITLAIGGGLWALPVSILLQLLVFLVIILRLRRDFFQKFWTKGAENTVSWSEEILPMQWRLGVQALVSYFSFPFFTALAFKTIGAIEAGQLGMTLQLITGVQTLGIVFIGARVAELGNLVGSRRTNDFYTLWTSSSMQALYATFCLLLFVIALALLGPKIHETMNNRLLSISYILVFSAGALFTVIPQSIAVFFRVHKIEVFTSIGVTTGVLMGSISFILSHNIGLSGFPLTYLIVTVLFTVPSSIYIYYKNKAQVISKDLTSGIR